MKRRAKKTRKPPKPTLYVAVILTDPEHADVQCSGRPMGDWASFVGHSRDNVVRKAMAAAARWDPENIKEYEIAVGTLTSRAEAPTRFSLVPM